MITPFLLSNIKLTAYPVQIIPAGLLYSSMIQMYINKVLESEDAIIQRFNKKEQLESNLRFRRNRLYFFMGGVAPTAIGLIYKLGGSALPFPLPLTFSFAFYFLRLSFLTNIYSVTLDFVFVQVNKLTRLKLPPYLCSWLC